MALRSRHISEVEHTATVRSTNHGQHFLRVPQRCQVYAASLKQKKGNTCKA